MRAAFPPLRELIYWTVPGALVLCCCLEPCAFSSQLLSPDEPGDGEAYIWLVVLKVLEHNWSCTCDQIKQIARPSPTVFVFPLKCRINLGKVLQNLHTTWCVIHDITSHWINGRCALFILYWNNNLRPVCWMLHKITMKSIKMTHFIRTLYLRKYSMLCFLSCDHFSSFICFYCLFFNI